MFVKLSLLLSLTALALAAPSTSSPEAAPFAARKAALEARALDTAQHCGQYDNARAGNYILNLDQWGRTSSTPGSDCAQFTHQSGNTVGWKSTWSWSGGGIKSYSNIQLTAGINKQLSAIKSAQVRRSPSSVLSMLKEM
jgi:xyloglucan-specific endo-beta-1,4-glucanase